MPLSIRQVTLIDRCGLAHDNAFALTFAIMDQLQYFYQGNRLIAVDDAVNTSGRGKDFNEGEQKYCRTDPENTEYTYDAAGSLLTDKHKQIKHITYNHLNLPVVIEFEAQPGVTRQILNTYDAADTKLRKRVLETGGFVDIDKTTDYQDNLVYQREEGMTNFRLDFIHTAEGRILAEMDETDSTKIATLAYEYHYKDHLGNLRLAIRDRTTTYSADFESLDGDNAEFARVQETRAIVNPDFYTSSDHALHLNAQSAQGPLGAYRIFKVNKGDVVTATVQAGYEAQPSYQNLSISTSSIGSSYGLDGTVFHTTGITAPDVTNPNSSHPNAYLRILLVDEDGQELPYQATPAHMGIAHRNSMAQLSTSKAITTPCYAIVYVANESDANAYFDDLTLTHRQLIAQENNYYPFGMEMVGAGYSENEQQRHKYGYQGQELEERFGLSWQEFQLRAFDSQLGRWHTQDPYEQYHSPYLGMGNNPVNGIDPDGGFFLDGKHIRQAKLFAKTVGGRIDIFRVKGKGRVADVYGFAYDGDAPGTYSATSVRFVKGQDRSDLLEASGAGFYDRQIAGAEGIGNQIKWRLKAGDAWAAGVGQYDRNGQAPTFAKVMNGFNPLFSVPNAVSAITTKKDLYGMDASHPVDQGLAWGTVILTPLGLFGKVPSVAGAVDEMVAGSSTAARMKTVIDDASELNNLFNPLNDAGSLNPVKDLFPAPKPHSPDLLPKKEDKNEEGRNSMFDNSPNGFRSIGN